MMSTNEVLAFYGMAYHTLTSMRRSGLPYIEVGVKKYEYVYEDVEKWLNLDGSVYPKDRILIGLDKIKEMTGLTKSMIYTELKNHYLPYYDLRGNKGKKMYRFDYNEILEWFEDYKERKGLIWIITKWHLMMYAIFIIYQLPIYIY